MKSNNQQIDGPPTCEPCEAETNPKAVFMSLFNAGLFTPESLEQTYLNVMQGRLGIHMRLVGCFWAIEGIENPLNNFHDFVVVNKVPVKTTWEPRHEGGWYGVQFWGAKLEDCLKISE